VPPFILPDRPDRPLRRTRRRGTLSRLAGCGAERPWSPARAAASARRPCADRLAELATATGAVPVRADVTDGAAVRRLAAAAGDCSVLVNCAGVAIGLEPVAEADPASWAAMYDVNVLGVLRVTQALLPALVASGDGIVVTIGSTAGHLVYEGGGGYTAAKHGAAALSETLRLELCGQPVRVTEIAPGMVRTDEFSLNRFGGDAGRAAAVYRGVRDPLVAEDVADAVGWVVTRPAHVNIDLMVIKPRAQAAQHKVHREPDG
jgi:NADP-dependent 3-hydroxy acid dehydrogenase YdfG